ncbi:MCP four helix bundle domain-containing protein [Polaribacter septentrionalilitoris]|uniref:MCP four helix bundle domain-containing protein n=1 Tax=Polaribacter septentrionalilitoris TaxID=2494657 RepID=UPI001359EAFB|nr:MCP four helix bundle domain-containing protein [Polaribacter septentrionalilitoris]
MSIYNKVKSILGVLIIFIIIITTNLVDKNNFNRVKQTVVNIYQDRLIANNIIFEISKNIHLKEKEVLLNNSARLSSKDDIINSSIENLIFDFEQTKLTIEEAKTLTNLKDNIKLLFDLENKNIENPSHDLKSKMMMKFSEIDKNLIKLSKIQKFK